MSIAKVSFGFNGKVNALTYFTAGVLLFGVKFFIDHLIAGTVFHRSWTPLDYVAPGLNMPALLHDTPDRWFYATMMLIALPFTYIGLVLTVQRLRSANIPRSLVVLFFVPILNLFYFVLLTLIPEHRIEPIGTARVAAQPTPLNEPIVLPYGHEEITRSGLASFFPEGDTASAVVAILLPIPLVTALTLMATVFFKDYGFGLFIGMPFVLGLTSSVLYGIRKPRRLRQCLGVSIISLIVASCSLLIFGIEGAGCLIMLLPLASPIVLLGAWMGYACQKRPMPPGSNWSMLGGMILMLPLFMGAEHIAEESAPLLMVTSSVEINASPQTVWKHVIDFPPLAEPTEWIFRVGIAYPKYATIDGAGPGAIRKCVFSTGPFIEPIQIWDAPRLLKFSVTSNPPPMQEWSPYRIHPPHLQNFLVSQGGQFQLVPLLNNRTRLIGTTWYRHNMWPAAYWQLWSDYLIHRIHLRVLNHVKQLSEAENGTS